MNSDDEDRGRAAAGRPGRAHRAPRPRPSSPRLHRLARDTRDRKRSSRRHTQRLLPAAAPCCGAAQRPRPSQRQWSRTCGGAELEPRRTSALLSGVLRDRGDTSARAPARRSRAAWRSGGRSARRQTLLAKVNAKLGRAPRQPGTLRHAHCGRQTRVSMYRASAGRRAPGLRGCG